MRPSLTLTTSVRRRAAAAVAVVALTGLVACTPRAGSAAVVGDTRVTVDQVQADSRELLELAEAQGAGTVDTADLNRRQIARIVTDLLIREAAERRDIRVTQGQVDALIRESAAGGDPQELAEQVALSEGVPVSEFRSFAEVVLLNQELLAAVAPEASAAEASVALVAELAALSEELGVSVNPRFGTWDAANLNVSLPPDDLSSPAPTPAPEVTSGEVVAD